MYFRAKNTLNCNHHHTPKYSLNYYFLFLDCFDVLMSKIIKKNKKKYYFDVFPSEKHFKPQHS
jgi:hypothetical protein